MSDRRLASKPPRLRRVSAPPPQLVTLLDNIRTLVETAERDGRPVDEVYMGVDANAYLLGYENYVDNWKARPPDGWLALFLNDGRAVRLPIIVTDTLKGGMLNARMGDVTDPVWTDV